VVGNKLVWIMIDFPKVNKSFARGVSGRRSIKKIIGSLVIAAGIAVSGSGNVEASVPSGSDSSYNAQGSIVFTPATVTGDQVAYHQSHRSHYSHQSHRSHYSHYSSRW